MLTIRQKANVLLILLICICLVLWQLGNAVVALSVFSITLLVFIIPHILDLHALDIWLKKPSTETIPEGHWLWEDVYAMLYRYERSNQAKQAQLNTALEQFNLTAGALPDGLVVLSATNLIEWCTPNAEHQLGLDLRYDQNKPIYNLVRDSDFIAYLYNANFSEPYKLKSRHQEDMVFEIRLIPFANQQKLLICRDMTQLEKVDIMRRDFIANVSHELRTPLTVVGGFLETLSDMEGAIPEHLQRYFALMQEQTQRMRRIIEDLLTLSRLESSINTPEDQQIDMSNILGMLRNDAEGLSLGQHRIKLNIDEKLHLKGSAEELLSAFSNLVSNAIRYTPIDGEIEISWHSYGDHQAILSVRDSGIGIASEHIDRLTERFYRVDKGRSRDTGGTGLGLAIVKHILNRHQAKLEISSEIGKGSVFSVVFPQARILVM